MNEFSKVFHEVSQKVSNESRKSNSSQMRYRLDNAIIFWCEELKFSDNITNYILLKQNIPEIEKLIDCN